MVTPPWSIGGMLCPLGLRNTAYYTPPLAHALNAGGARRMGATGVAGECDLSVNMLLGIRKTWRHDHQATFDGSP